MYNSNQTYRSGTYIGDPYIFTGNQCKTEYAIANATLKHINVYDSKFARLSYPLLFELKGNIKEVIDGYSEFRSSDNGVNSNYGKRHVFNERKELLYFVHINGIAQDKVKFIPSLKDLKEKIVTRSYSSKTSYKLKLSTVNKVLYDKNMQIQQFEEIQVYNDSSARIFPAPIVNEKYAYKDGEIIQKTRFINTSNEHSRAIIKFDRLHNIIEVKANNQSSKKDIIYEAKYDYSDKGNIKRIVFTNNSIPITAHGHKIQYEFEYDSSGNLKTYRLYSPLHLSILPPRLVKEIKYQHDSMNNLTKKSEGEFTYLYKYKYDRLGNWVNKNIQQLKNNEEIYKCYINRKIEYRK